MQIRNLRLALIFSATLNLFALGALGGVAWTWSHPGPQVRVHRERPILSAADRLPPAEASRFRSVIRAVLSSARPLQRSARESRTLAAALFEAPTFDADAVSTALAQARAADLSLRTQLEAAVVDFAKGLPPSERATLAEGLARRGPLRHPQPR